MNYNLESVKQIYNQGKALKYVFFWGHQPLKDGSISKSCLSQWYNCSFIVDNIPYNTAEHFMIAQKTKLFNHDITFQNIINATHSNQFKKFSRKVKILMLKFGKI